MADRLPFASVRLQAMSSFTSSTLRPLLMVLLCLVLNHSTRAQRGAWLDIVPMTRNLFGADDAQDLSFAVGWSTATTDDGWRALVGFDLSEETQDNFGTAITTTNRRIDLGSVPNGSYLLRAHTSDATETRKVIVRH